MSGAGLVFIRTERTMRRWEGAALLVGYVVFLVVLAVR
jgi:Ca2+/Na+ antiporter